MLVKRSFSLSGHRTSVALEAPFWDVLTTMAARQGRALGALVAEIDAARAPGDPLASKLRIMALQSALTESQGKAGKPEPR